MEKSIKVTVFPRPNSDVCGSGCSISCASCGKCEISCGFYEAELELMDKLYFMMEEIGYNLGKQVEMEIIDTGDLQYYLERLNMVLITNGESPVNYEYYGEYMTISAPLIAVNKRIVAMGEIPEKVLMMALVQEALITNFP